MRRGTQVADGKPQGVRGRNSDNTLLRKTLGWEPDIPLEKGLAITYNWINGELKKKKEVGELAEVAGD